MARPRKCRICGYRFRGNEDICPECFTARDDDISCNQFSNSEHSHGSGLSTTESSDVYDEFKERSFIDEQRSEEAKDPIPSSTYGSRQGTPPPTYAQQSYSQPRARNGYSAGGQSRQDKLDALRNARQAPRGQGYNPQNVYFGQNGTAPNGNPVYYTRNGQKQKSNAGVVAVVVIIMLVAFFIPVIRSIVQNYGVSSNKAKSKSTTTKKNNIDISYTMPDFSMPSVSIPDVEDLDPRQASVMDNGYQLYAKNIEAGEVILPDRLEDNFSEEEIKTHRVAEGYLPEGYVRLSMNLSSVSVDINDPSSPDIVAMGCYLETLDSQGLVICTSYIMDERETGTEIRDAAFLVPSDYKEFKLYLLVNSKTGEAVHKLIPIKRFNIQPDKKKDDNSTRAESDTSSSKKDKTA